jgi:hypothetical protein
MNNNHQDEARARIDAVMGELSQEEKDAMRLLVDLIRRSVLLDALEKANARLRQD